MQRHNKIELSHANVSKGKVPILRIFLPNKISENVFSPEGTSWCLQGSHIFIKFVPGKYQNMNAKPESMLWDVSKLPLRA